MILPIVILTLGILNIWVSVQKKERLIYITKPLVMLGIISMLPISGVPFEFYQWLILAGLIFSMLGDIFLMLPSDRFIQGLISFLLAHICYIVAFFSQTQFENGHILWLLPFIIYGLLMFYLLAPQLGKLKWPVIFYMLVIMTMGWMACCWWVYSHSWSAMAAFAGALLFIASDTSLAVNRFLFNKQMPLAQLYILATYFPAQWLIAFSAGGG